MTHLPDSTTPPDQTPRMVARRQAILDAAAIVFFEQGFERASLSAIVKRSGGSLSTLYQLFGSKEGLFEAMISQRCVLIMDSLMQPDLPQRDLRETLTGLVRNLTSVLMTPEAQGLWRMVIAEGVKFPRLAEIYFRCGPDKAITALCSYLAALHERGAIHCPAPDVAARTFSTMAQGEHFYRIVTGVRAPLTPDECDTHAAQVVDMFLRILAARG